MNVQTICQIIEKNDLDSLNYALKLENESISLRNVKISKSFTPVNKPTTRGGVYSSEKEVFKISGIIDNTSVISQLSNYMLGPNTEFKKLKIIIKNFFTIPNKKIVLFTNLINSIQKSHYVELNMIIVDTEIINE